MLLTRRIEQQSEEKPSPATLDAAAVDAVGPLSERSDRESPIQMHWLVLRLSSFFLKKKKMNKFKKILFGQENVWKSEMPVEQVATAEEWTLAINC